MPKKKNAVPDEQPVEALSTDTGGEENAGLPPEIPAEGDGPGSDAALPADAPGEDAPASAGDVPAEGDFPVGEETPFPPADGAGDVQLPADGLGPQSDDPEYGALLQELGEGGHAAPGGEEPLTLGPPPARSRPVM